MTMLGRRPESPFTVWCGSVSRLVISREPDLVDGPFARFAYIDADKRWHVEATGYYSRGLPAGTWTWHAKDGSLVKSISIERVGHQGRVLASITGVEETRTAEMACPTTGVTSPSSDPLHACRSQGRQVVEMADGGVSEEFVAGERRLECPPATRVVLAEMPQKLWLYDRSWMLRTVSCVGSTREGEFWAFEDDPTKLTVLGSFSAGERVGVWRTIDRQRVVEVVYDAGHPKKVVAVEDGSKTIVMWIEGSKFKIERRRVGSDAVLEEGPASLIQAGEPGQMVLRRTGDWVERDMDGQIQATGPYVDGERHGRWMIYEGGQVSRVAIFREGVTEEAQSEADTLLAFHPDDPRVLKGLVWCRLLAAQTGDGCDLGENSAAASKWCSEHWRPAVEAGGRATAREVRAEFCGSPSNAHSMTNSRTGTSATWTSDECISIMKSWCD